MEGMVSSLFLTSFICGSVCPLGEKQNILASYQYLPCGNFFPFSLSSTTRNCGGRSQWLEMQVREYETFFVVVSAFVGNIDILATKTLTTTKNCTTLYSEKLRTIFWKNIFLKYGTRKLLRATCQILYCV